MNPIDSEIVSHARRWAPFGGPSMDDVFLTFGMTPRIYHRRIARILCVVERRALTAEDKQMLANVLESVHAHSCTNMSPAHCESGAPSDEGHADLDVADRGTIETDRRQA